MQQGRSTFLLSFPFFPPLHMTISHVNNYSLYLCLVPYKVALLRQNVIPDVMFLIFTCNAYSQAQGRGNIACCKVTTVMGYGQEGDASLDQAICCLWSLTAQPFSLKSNTLLWTTCYPLYHHILKVFLICWLLGYLIHNDLEKFLPSFLSCG